MTASDQFDIVSNYDFAEFVFTPDSSKTWPDNLPRDGYYGFFLLARFAGESLFAYINRLDIRDEYQSYPELALSYLESGTEFEDKNIFQQQKPLAFLLVKLLSVYLQRKKNLDNDHKVRSDLFSQLDLLIHIIEKSRSSSNFLRSMDVRLAKCWCRLLKAFIYVNEGAITDIKYDFRKDLDTASRRGICRPYILWIENTFKFQILAAEGKTGKILLLAENWEKHAAKYPDYLNPFEFDLLALEYLNAAEEFSLAIEWVDMLLFRSPNFLPFVKWNIRFLRETGDIEVARKYCLQNLKKHKYDDDLYCFLSNIYFMEGEYEEAVQAGNSAVLLGKEKSSNHTALAYALMYEEEFEASVEAFSTAIFLDEQNVNAYRGKAKSLFMQDQYFPAICCLYKIFQIFPDSVELCQDLADMYFMCGYLKESRKYSKMCIAMDDQCAGAYVLLGMLDSRTSDEENAVNWLKRALELDPENPVAMNELAYLQHTRGNNDECMQLLENAIHIAPDYADAMCSLAIVHFYQTQYEDALLYFNKTLSLDPFHVGALVGKGNLYLAQCECAEAIQWYDRALEIDPFFQDAIQGKINSYRSMGLEDEACEWIEKMKNNGDHDNENA